MGAVTRSALPFKRPHRRLRNSQASRERNSFAVSASFIWPENTSGTMSFDLPRKAGVHCEAVGTQNSVRQSGGKA